jgi:hypothetical protein
MCSTAATPIPLPMDVVLGESRKKLVLNLPPRSLKSLIVSVCLPAWLLGGNAGARIICASYSQDLADKFSRDCRALIETPFYKRVFPRTRLNPRKNTEGELETTRRGYRLATSVGGTLTGRGGDVLIVDPQDIPPPSRDPDKDPVIAGQLRAPRRVIGGRERWRNRIIGLAQDLRKRLAEIEEENEAQGAILRRSLNDLEAFAAYALPLGGWALLEGEDTLPIILHIDDGPFILGSGIQGFVEATE